MVAVNERTAKAVAKGVSLKGGLAAVAADATARTPTNCRGSCTAAAQRELTPNDGWHYFVPEDASADHHGW